MAKKRAKASGRGRKADPSETARRVTMLERVQAGELNNAAAAWELGRNLGTWAVRKSGYLTRSGGGAKPAARRGRPPGSARRPRPPGKATARASAPTGNLAGVVAKIEGLQRFDEELRDRVRAMAEMARRQFPG